MDDFDSIPLPSHANPIVIQWLKQGKLKIMPSGCWEWQKCRNKGRYGRVTINGIVHLTSRLSIDAPCNLHSLHSCDNPPCCNPWHLRTGTPFENAIDKKLRRRGLRLGLMPRCLCGMAVSAKSETKCRECKAILQSNYCHCGAPAIKKSMCSTHYRRDISNKKRLGIFLIQSRKGPPCDCGLPHFAKGFCNKHYQSMMKSKDRKND